MNIVELIREQRQRRHNAGEDSRLGPALRAVCEQENVCPQCRLGAGWVIQRWNGNVPVIGACQTCGGRGGWTPEAAHYRTLHHG